MRLTARAFFRSLRGNPAFLVDAKRVALIATGAIVVNAATFGLAKSGMDLDANAHQVIEFATYASSLIGIFAMVWCIIRCTDEFICFYIDLLDR
jgi:hypothetical protein